MDGRKFGLRNNFIKYKMIAIKITAAKMRFIRVVSSNLIIRVMKHAEIIRIIHIAKILPAEMFTINIPSIYNL